MRNNTLCRSIWINDNFIPLDEQVFWHNGEISLWQDLPETIRQKLFEKAEWVEQTLQDDYTM